MVVLFFCFILCLERSLNMKVFAIIAVILVLIGLAAFIVYQSIQLVKTIKIRIKDKKEKQHEKGNQK